MMNSRPLEVGDPLPEMRVCITDENVKAFGDIANDHSRMHFDDAFARARGFPAAIAHGAIAASTFPLLLDRCFSGWPGQRQKLKITFIGAAYRGDAVLTGGRVAAIDGDAVVVELWCVAGERKLAVAEATGSRSAFRASDNDRVPDIRKGNV